MKTYYKWVIRAASGLNALFALWVLYNGINENFAAPPVAKLGYLSLIALLLLNSVLLFLDQKRA